MMQDPTTPVTEPESDVSEADAAPYQFNIRTTQQDPELRVIDATLVILRYLSYDRRMRAITYIRDRLESDHRALHGTEPTPAVVPATSSAIAQVLAESDGHDWNRLAPIGQAPYFRRAQALFSAGLA